MVILPLLFSKTSRRMSAGSTIRRYAQPLTRGLSCDIKFGPNELSAIFIFQTPQQRVVAVSPNLRDKIKSLADSLASPISMIALLLS